jgi:hypothetical protein
MRKAYQAIAWLIPGLVMLQAAALAFGVAGENRYVDEGGVVDKALIESTMAGGEPPFPEVIGFSIHWMNGGMIIPLVALILMAVSFGAGFAGARKWAGITLLLVVVQVMLGFSLGEVPALGLLHGMNALLLFAAALHAGRLAGRAARQETTTQQRESAPVA